MCGLESERGKLKFDAPLNWIVDRSKWSLSFLQLIMILYQFMSVWIRVCITLYSIAATRFTAKFRTFSELGRLVKCSDQGRGQCSG